MSCKVVAAAMSKYVMNQIAKNDLRHNNERESGWRYYLQVTLSRIFEVEQDSFSFILNKATPEQYLAIQNNNSIQNVYITEMNNNRILYKDVLGMGWRKFLATHSFEEHAPCSWTYQEIAITSYFTCLSLEMVRLYDAGILTPQEWWNTLLIFYDNYEYEFSATVLPFTAELNQYETSDDISGQKEYRALLSDPEFEEELKDPVFNAAVKHHIQYKKKRWSMIKKCEELARKR